MKNQVTMTNSEYRGFVWVQDGNVKVPYKELKLLGCTFTLADEERVHLHNKFKYRLAAIKLQ